MDVDPGYKFMEKFTGGISWYTMESKDFVSSFNFKLENEENDLVSFLDKVFFFDYQLKKFIFFRMTETSISSKYSPN